MAFSNSPLISFTRLSPNHSGQRTHPIDRITPHCVVGQCAIETLGAVFANPDRQASSNYGIGKDGRVGMFVEEQNRSWCSSSNANDQRAVTIECASDATEPYAFNSLVYSRLIDLCTDICLRNGKTKLLWIPDKDEALAYEPEADEMLLTVHRWFANKSCPGEWLYSRLSDLAGFVTHNLTALNAPQEPEKEEEPQPQEEEPESDTVYRVQVGAYKSKISAERLIDKLKEIGLDGYIVKTETVKTSVDEIEPYTIRINTELLNVRKAPSLQAEVVTTVRRGGVYTIVGESNGFGRLKSGIGWIMLSYTERNAK